MPALEPSKTPPLIESAGRITVDAREKDYHWQMMHTLLTNCKALAAAKELDRRTRNQLIVLGHTFQTIGAPNEV